MDIPNTTKLTYSKGKAGKTFSEYTLNETGNYPESLRVVEKGEQYYLSIKQDSKWVQYKMYPTDHFHFYALSVPIRGAEIIVVVYFEPSFSIIELRISENVNVEHGNMVVLNELINLIIYKF